MTTLHYEPLGRVSIAGNFYKVHEVVPLVPCKREGDQGKSYYGRAKVLTTDLGYVLQSYLTAVMFVPYKNKHVHYDLWGGSSHTTSKHISAFLRQYESRSCSYSVPIRHVPTLESLDDIPDDIMDDSLGIPKAFMNLPEANLSCYQIRDNKWIKAPRFTFGWRIPYCVERLPGEDWALAKIYLYADWRARRKVINYFGSMSEALAACVTIAKLTTQTGTNYV